MLNGVSELPTGVRPSRECTSGLPVDWGGEADEKGEQAQWEKILPHLHPSIRVLFVSTIFPPKESYFLKQICQKTKRFLFQNNVFHKMKISVYQRAC